LGDEVGKIITTNESQDGAKWLPLVQAIEPRDQTNFLPGAPDRDFQQRLMGTLMALIVGCLSMEWLIRRLSKLA